MTTYQIFRGDEMIADNININELFNLIPAGSQLISGNRTEIIRKPNGCFEQHTEVKAVYKLMTGFNLTVIQKI